MNYFTNISTKFKDVSILILGSYRPDNIEILQNLRNFLKKKGFENARLANDVEKNIQGDSYGEKMGAILAKIVDIMLMSEFNIFVIFDEANDSTLIELGEFVSSNEFLNKKSKTLVFLPRHYDKSMLVGYIHNKKINVHQYDFGSDILQFCLTFITNNLA
ncbi:MAG: hypothetical protein ACTSVI_10390 [Promethearchaeota archaeon]